MPARPSAPAGRPAPQQCFYSFMVEGSQPTTPAADSHLILGISLFVLESSVLVLYHLYSGKLITCSRRLIGFLYHLPGVVAQYLMIYRTPDKKIVPTTFYFLIFYEIK